MAQKTIRDFQMQLVKVEEEKEALKIEYENKIKELENKIYLYEIEKNKAKTENNIESIEASTIKKILLYKSQQYSINLITEKLNYRGINITIDQVSDVVNNIDSLELDIQNYYKECQVEFEKSLKINTDLIFTSILEDVQNNIDSIWKDINEVPPGDIYLKNQLRDRLEKQLKLKNDIGKNINFDSSGLNSKELSIISNAREQYEKMKSKVVKLNFGKNIPSLEDLG